MPQPEENFGDRTTIFRRDDTIPVQIQEEFGHYLVAIGGMGLGRRLRLEAAPLVIGRDPSCGLVLASPDISRRHCQVDLLGGEVFVTDLKSTNGAYIDGKRIDGTGPLPDGSILEIGQVILKHERRSTREVEEAQELDRDLEKARNYVLSRLPPPLIADHVHTEWFIVPSAKVGGDAFGYAQLDDGTFVSYLIDVSGHGIGAAMLSVSILNVLRQRAIPGTDFRRPSQVLAGLNAMFQMENHNGMFFTIWYGVYDPKNHALTYASGGHHPAFVVGPDRQSVTPLRTDGPLIGALEDIEFSEGQAELPKGASLHIFSDGVFEIEDREGTQLGLQDFLPVLAQEAVEGRSEPQRIFQNVRERARPGPLDDDFSYLVLHFQ
jgi:serine phosphatase RsbU (regulator of sigma subunit)